MNNRDRINSRTLVVHAPSVRLNRRAFVGSMTASALAAMGPSALCAGPDPSIDPVNASVLALSKALRAGKFSCGEVVEALLRRIQAVNPKINAIVTLDEELALQEARRADAELARGELRGVLHGVPMTIKDSFDTKGVVTTAGTEGRRSFVPKRDATVVARLKSAGAILLGKTNTPEFTLSYDTGNLLFGYTKNPYNVDRSPGGSSGGAAAAVSAGLSPFDVGTDSGGSIRLPSCFCGTAGIKPTTGRVPLTGHIIRTGQGIMDSWTQAGPIARYVDDLWPLLRMIAGPDGKDPAVIPMPLKHPVLVDVKGLRIAFHSDNGIIPATGEVRRTVEAAASALADAGARVTESCPKALARLTDFWLLPNIVDGGQWIKTLLKESGTERWDPRLDWHWQYHALSGEQVGDLIRSWQRFRADMLAWMQDFDALICPVNARASWPSGFVTDMEDLPAFTYTAAFNFTDWPAAVVRAGNSDDGMPIGIQIVARPWREDVCVAVARHIEAELGGWQMPSI